MTRCTFTFDPTEDGPFDTPPPGVEDSWSCPHEAHPNAERCVFHLDADARASLAVDAEAVADRFLAIVKNGDARHKRLLGADLPTLHLEYEDLSGASRHPIDLRGSDIDGVELDHTTVSTPLDLRGSRLGRLDLTETEFEAGLLLGAATVEASITVADGSFDEEVQCPGLTVGGPTSFEGAVFEDDVCFDDVTFESQVSFAGAELYGRSNERDENTSFTGATFTAPATFDEATFEYVVFDDVDFEGAATFRSASFEGAVSATGCQFADLADFQDARFAADVTFADTRFVALADFDEARFGEDTSFSGVAFEATADFRGVEIAGGANVLEEDADFADATFAGPARFGAAEFTSATFTDVLFSEAASFEETRFDEDATFDGAIFEQLADFDESRFAEDVSFRAVAFEATADFRGVEVHGGANVLEDDADFESATFDGPARFDRAELTFVDFRDVRFGAEATFAEARFREDADFAGAAFGAQADFGEARFAADGDFSAVVFHGPANFRGVEFRGEARHRHDNARFDGATFSGLAEFDDAAFTSASFDGVTFADTADFQRAQFGTRLDITATAGSPHVFVNLSAADIDAGTIVQPNEDWVTYDLTRARLGDVSIDRAGEGAKDLFDYFRFVETDFDGFDFSAHRDALDRNNWQLHVLDDEDPDYEFAVAATPATTETTYLYAYTNAREMGDNDAAIEFAIHQAKFRRRKNVGYLRDASFSTSYRLSKLGDVVGNTLWHLSCGYGYRLWRILAVSVFVVITWGFLYALPFTRLDNEASLDSLAAVFSPDGVVAIAQYMYYSLITFTTVGYGDINPVNAAARTLAVTEGILGVLLAALVVFVLGRRVAV